MSANWFLPESAERFLRFACYTPTLEKYIHLFALCFGFIDVLVLFFLSFPFRFLTLVSRVFTLVPSCAFWTAIFGMGLYLICMYAYLFVRWSGSFM